MAWCCFRCLRLLALGPAGGPLPERPRHVGGSIMVIAREHPFLAPSLSVFAGFLLSGSMNTPWLVGVTVLVLVLAAYATHVARQSAGGAAVGGGVLAVITATTVLTLLGDLLAVRLIVARDPHGTVADGFTAEAVGAGWNAILLPLLLSAVVLAGLHLAGGRMRSGAAGRLHAWAGRLTSNPWRFTGRRFVIGAFAVVAALFLLPKLDPGGVTGDASLTFLGIALPEYGKIAFVLLLALVVARNSERYAAISLPAPARELWMLLTFRAGRDDRRVLLLKTRHLLYPLLFFIAVAVMSWLRRDFGTIVPALAAAIAVTWAATRRSMDLPSGRAAAGARLLRTLRGYQLFLVAGFGLLAVAVTAAFTTTDYIRNRGRIWADPWAHRWDGGCVVPERPPADAPAGVVLCQESMLANHESARSQMGKALAAVADGGLFGRGLEDSASAVVSAGATDFILAVMWNKLGGVAVLLSTLLLLLLGAALLQVARPVRRVPGGRSAAEVFAGLFAALFGAGLAGLLAGQHLFVFAATLNVIPHSGIPAPFLSRGGQATLAILAAIALTLTLASQTGASEPPAPVTGRWRRPWSGRAGTALAAACCVLGVAAVTVSPYTAPNPTGSSWPARYDSDRPVCPARRAETSSLLSAPVDPRRCSTDRIAYGRTKVQVRLAGGHTLLQDRENGRWVPSGREPHGLTLADLNGLLRVGSGGTGLIDQSFPEVLDATVGTRLAWRLLPPGPDRPADGGLDLTIDPRLQHLVAEALRSPGPDGSGPLAGGMVVIEARTGKILAAASVPVDNPVPSAPVDVAAAKSYVDAHSGYRPMADGTADGVTCDGDNARPRLCWRWSYQAAPAPDLEAAAADQRRYVGGDPNIDELPAAGVNRAMGQYYGPGSTFKVVIAAAYLRAGGQADDLLEAPDSIRLSSNVVIRNVKGNPCNAARRITLTQAMATSCNTAFVGLAQQLGWPAIAEQARLFGFHVGDCEPRHPHPAWLTPQLTGAVAPCVPKTVDRVAIGNSALGGQRVVGTPLGIATMMAAVANGGTAVQPSAVERLTYPDNGRTLPSVPPQTRIVLPAAANAELIETLALTAETGTARGLSDEIGTKVWAKTGTHDVVPAGAFVSVNSWLAGFVDTERGPIAFAVVQEAPRSEIGSARIRHLATVLGKALVTG